MRILITGAAGVIGGRLAKSLIVDGDDVRAFKNLSSARVYTGRFRAVGQGNKILDNSNARQDLGFQPRVCFAESMRQTINWFRERGFV